MVAAQEPMLPNAKRQRLNQIDGLNDPEITKKEMEHLFHLKQHDQPNHKDDSLEASLHSMTGHYHSPGDSHHMIRVSTAASSTVSISQSTDFTSMDALSTTAAIHSNPALTPSQEPSVSKDKAAETYYRQIIHRSSRVGDRYQAMTLPLPSSNTKNEAKYGGIAVEAESPTTLAAEMRQQRDQKREALNEKMSESLDDDDEEAELEETANGNVNGNNSFYGMNFDDEEDDDEDDEDFNIEDACNEETQSKRPMQGIIGRRSDWLCGDDGAPNDKNARCQYLVKWKDSVQPIWEFADDLEMYQQEIDQFEEDELDDELDEEMIGAVCRNMNGNQDKAAQPSSLDDSPYDICSWMA